MMLNNSHPKVGVLKLIKVRHFVSKQNLIKII